MRAVIRHVTKKRPRSKEDELVELARSGSLEKLKKAKPKDGFPLSAISSAIEGGNIKTFDFLVKSIFEKGGFQLRLFAWVEYAIDSGNMDMLQKVFDTFDVKPHEMKVGSAPRKGRLDILEYLVSKGSKCVDTSTTLKAAAQAHQMRVAEWLVARGVKFKNAQDLCASFSDNGELEMLKYVIKHGGKADYQACERAAYQGNIEILKYLHEIGCEWNYLTCVAAASGGHLDCLKYARDNGCEWNRHVYHAAMEAVRVHIMEYLRINGCPLPSLDVLKDAYECCGLSDDDLSDEDDNFRHIYHGDIFLARIYATMRELKAAAAIKKAQNEESSAIMAMKSLMSTIDANKKRVPENEYLKMCEKAQTIFDMMKRP